MRPMDISACLTANSPCRLKISEAGVGIVLVVRKRVAVVDESLDDIDRYGEIQTAQEQITHRRHADNFALEIEQRSTGITRIDVRGGLIYSWPS